MPFLVVGLGNPGPTYSGHRHNVGAMVAAVLAGRLGSRFKSHKAGADIADGRLSGEQTIVAVPRSYMNLSGPPVAGLVRFFKVSPEQLIVVHDELDLPAHTVRVKQGRRGRWPQRPALDQHHPGHQGLSASPGRRRASAGPDGPGRFRAAELPRQRAGRARTGSGGGRRRCRISDRPRLVGHSEPVALTRPDVGTEPL